MVRCRNECEKSWAGDDEMVIRRLLRIYSHMILPIGASLTRY